MRDLSAVYKQSVSSDARNYTVHLNVWKKTVDDNGNVSFPENTKSVYTSSDSLISMSIIDGQTSGNSFQLGQTFCPIISFTTVPNLNIKTGDKVQVDLVFTSFVKATLATGYIDEYSYDSIDYAVSYTAYGKMIQLDKDYNSALTYPATFSAMVNEICSQNGLTFDTFDWKCNAKLKAKPVFGNLDNGDPAYASAREMLGIIAGVNGCNVIVTADEKVKFVPYTDTKTGITYEDAFSRQVNNEKYVIKKAVLNDGGQTSGNEAGYVELYFPLETVEGKASCLEKLNSVITGLSVMGMTVQIQGRGYYEIGDMLSYTDFDGEKYTIGIMGIKYDFSGGYFTETLYSLAPSEMEEQYKGNVRYSSTSTTLKNPIVLSENTSSYLQYNYTVIGYRKGDKLTEAEGSKSFFINGFKIANDWAEDSLNGNQALSFDELAPNIAHRDYPKNLRASFRILEVHPSGAITWTLDYSYLDTSTGENVVHRGTNALLSTNGIAPLFLTRWLRIHSPSETYPYGYAELDIEVKYYDQYGTLHKSEGLLPVVIKLCNPCFTSIAEYNAAINLTSEPLIAYDVSQEVMQIVEGDTPADLPEYGNSKTLYLTTTPAASWKYDVSKQKYVCVGRNYRELQRIKSSTEESNALEVFNVPVIFDCRTKTEWELEANTVYPKGFMIFEQNPESREITKLKIANGIDKLSDLKYTNVTESELPTKTSQLENDSGFLTEETDPTVPAWAKAETKPTYTAAEVGAAAKSHTHSKSDITDFPTAMKNPSALTVQMNGTTAAKYDGGTAKTINITPSGIGAATADDISAAINAVEIGGRNYLLNTKSFTSASSTSLNGSLITGTSLLEDKYRDLAVRGRTLAEGEVTTVCRYNFTDFNLGDTFTFSFFAKGDVSRLNAYFHGNPGYVQVAKSINSQGAKSSTNADGWLPFYITSDWQRYWITWTLKSTGDISVAKYVMLRTTNAISGQTVYVCGCKLEKGNKATDWTPAPEDDERRIASLEARVAALEAAAVSGGE